MDDSSGRAVDETAGAVDENAGAARRTTVLLTEEPVTGPDLERILAIHPASAEDPTHRYEVLVPVQDRTPGLSEAIDALALGEVREAFDELRGGGKNAPSTDHHEAARAAEEVLADTLASLRRHDRDARGSVTHSDPVGATATTVQRAEADDVVVVTRPRFVEDTLHTDWASRLRQVLDVPVLHVYGGTTSTG